MELQQRCEQMEVILDAVWDSRRSVPARAPAPCSLGSAPVSHAIWGVGSRYKRRRIPTRGTVATRWHASLAARIARKNSAVPKATQVFCRDPEPFLPRVRWARGGATMHSASPDRAIVQAHGAMTARTHFAKPASSAPNDQGDKIVIEPSKYSPHETRAVRENIDGPTARNAFAATENSRMKPPGRPDRPHARLRDRTCGSLSR